MKKKYFGDFDRKPNINLIKEKGWNYLKGRYRLSERELQVAKLICEGLTGDEIAQKLTIKPGTVKTHTRNIYRRVRVKNRILLLLRFVENAYIYKVPS